MRVGEHEPRSLRPGTQTAGTPAHQSASNCDLNLDLVLLADEVPALLAFIDTKQRYRCVNRAHEEFYSVPVLAIIGQSMAEVNGPEHHAVAEQYVQRALGGERVAFRAPLKRRNGLLTEVEVSYTPYLDDGSGVTGFVSFTREVTDQEQPSGAETRERLAAIVDSSDDAIVSKTLDGVITSWNRSAERIFGYTAAEAIGQHITLIIPPERRAEEDQVLARLRRGEKVDHFETERQTKDGRTVDISLSVAPIRNGAGVIVGAAKVARDITERKRSEAALRALEEYRRAVLESMPECVQVLDGSGMIVHTNAAGLRMIEGTNPEDVVGQCVYPLVHEKDREAFQALNANVFAGGCGGTLEFSMRCLKGSERIVEANVVPLRGAAGEVIGALSVTRDITSRKHAEARDAFLVRLDDASRQLSDATELMRRAAAMLAEHLGVERCAYAEVDRNAGLLRVSGDYTRNVPSIVGVHPLATFGHEFREKMEAAEPYVVRDVEGELGRAEPREAFRNLQIGATIAVPLFKGGQLVACLTVHQSSPRNWRADEIELVQIVANRCWESIERARVEQDLRENEQQFRTLANAIPNLAWMANADGYVFWYNRRWYEYTGSRPEEMEGWGWQSVHDPAVLPSVLEKWRHSIRTGEPFEMVFPVRGADGRFREFITRIEPVKDVSGRLTRWFGTSTDVTAQQEAERREKRSRETAELLNRVAPVLLAELNTQKLTQTITDLATEAVRAQCGAFFYNALSEPGESYVLYTVSGASREAFSSFPMPRATQVFGGEGIVRSDDIMKDPRYGHSPPYDGMPAEHLPVRSYLAVPVRSRAGTVLGGLFFGHSDVGAFTAEAEAIANGIAAQAAIALDNASLFEEAKRSSEALRRSNEDLKRLNEDLNQFAYSASHDLREPLRMVSIYTQFLSRKLSSQLDAEGSRFVDHILTGTSRLEALIRDLLAYTKAAETSDSPAGPTDANRALGNALANLSASLEETGTEVTAEPKLPSVAVAEVHLTQLLQNLIGNAIKYRGQNAPEIRIGADRRHDFWEFFVADNGIGIDPAYKEHIFGIFKRLHNASEYSGTGIGLAICQRIVQRYGGRIWVESQPGRGSTFFFTLPAGE